MVRGFARRVWLFLAKMNVAVTLMFIILLLAAFGSLFPQMSSEVETDPLLWLHWRAFARARYGALGDLLLAAGVFRFFRSPVFLLSLTSLVIITIVCTLHRWHGVWRDALRRPARYSDMMVLASPHRARLNGHLEASDIERVKTYLDARGFQVHSEVVDGVVYLQGDRHRWSPLATLVTHLAVLLLLIGVTVSGLFAWREELVIKPDRPAALEHDRELSVRYERFDIVRYPDGSPADYRASVAVYRGEQLITRGVVRVNEPLKFSGIALLLKSYAQGDEGDQVILQAVHDPGFATVVAGGVLLLLGMLVSFYFPRCCIYVRAEPGEGIRIAGRGSRYAADFEREFRELVDELKMALVSAGGEEA